MLGGAKIEDFGGSTGGRSVVRAAWIMTHSLLKYLELMTIIIDHAARDHSVIILL